MTTDTTTEQPQTQQRAHPKWRIFKSQCRPLWLAFIPGTKPRRFPTREAAQAWVDEQVARG